MIRRVRADDRGYVLQYCAGTFGWGDYVSDVWDDWMSDGLFLAYADCGHGPRRNGARQPQARQRSARTRGGDPVGICHAHISDRQIWIEGIRVHPGCRRRGIASALVDSAERMALDWHGPKMSGACAPAHQKVWACRMLIDVTNGPSIAMTRLLGYRTTSTWTYYSLRPLQQHADAGRAGNDVPCGVVCGPAAAAAAFAHADASGHLHYVDSWRWLEADETALRELASKDAVAATFTAGSRTSRGAGTIPTVSISTMSRSVGRGGGLELYAALYPGSGPGHVEAMVGHLADAAARSGCRFVSVFSQDGSLPACDGVLTRRLAFHLVEKAMVQG